MIIFTHDVVEANGKTVKENNLEETHTIPIGALVEINEDSTDEHRTRQFVAKHSRDCDGSPLYTLTVYRDLCDDRCDETFDNDHVDKFLKNIHMAKYSTGWGHDSLTVVE